MKVACIGNINNMLFVVCRYLRDYGIDCDLLLFNNEQSHFLPECDSYTEDYKQYTKNLTWGSIDSFSKTSVHQIKSDLATYDFIIATQDLAFFHKAQIKVDVFFPAGADLYLKPYAVDKLTWIQKARQRNLVNFVTSHKQGIQDSTIINQEPFSEPYKSVLADLQVTNQSYYFGAPLVYQPMYNPIEKSVSSIYMNQIDEIRKSTDLMIVNQARQLWKEDSLGGHPNKRSDHLIEGFARFLETQKVSNARLVLLEYGADVEHSKALISTLGISDYVTWLPKMMRKELMYAVSIADFACGEFDPGCIGGLTTWEALASGTCLLHYLNEDLVKFDEFTGIYPFVNVHYPTEISQVLQSYVNDPSEFKEIGEKGAHWYRTNFGENCVQKWVDLISIKKTSGTKGLESYVSEKLANQPTAV